MIINTGLPLAGGVRFSSGSYSGVDPTEYNSGTILATKTIDVGFEPKAFFVCGVPTKSQLRPRNWGYGVPVPQLGGDGKLLHLQYPHQRVRDRGHLVREV